MLRLSLIAAALLAFASAPAQAQRPSSAHRQSTAHVDRATAQRPLATVERRGSLLARRISVSLDDARRSHERVIARCLSSHLSQVHGLLRQVEYRKLLAVRRDAAGDTRGVAGLVQVASVFHQRLRALDAGSRRCQGGELGPSRGTVVITEVDASVPTEDPTRLPTGTRPLFDLPRTLSPTI
ncbi:MAG: hypothetical protein GXP55_05375 [Deltaproteobacteria bacterium]|nr:hypothetical protein [Deltaproteobacteria bacterium]